jgi:hypothetical protein
MSVEFTSKNSWATWMLTNIYTPCDPAGRDKFLTWLSDIVMPDDTDWPILGDFNQIKKSFG